MYRMFLCYFHGQLITASQQKTNQLCHCSIYFVSFKSSGWRCVLAVFMPANACAENITVLPHVDFLNQPLCVPCSRNLSHGSAAHNPNPENMAKSSSICCLEITTMSGSHQFVYLLRRFPVSLQYLHHFTFCQEHCRDRCWAGLGNHQRD